MIKIVDIIGLAIYCGLIYWLSDQPSLPMPALFPSQDKLVHMCAYFMMGVFAWRVFRHYFNTRQILILTIVAFCSLYGISDEWHQTFVPGRTADALDWLADTVGSFFAAYLLTRLFPPRNQQFADDRKTVSNS